MSIDLQISPELVSRMSKRGPRYTSYPTAVVFSETFAPATYAEALAQLGAANRDLSLYVHLPFCRSLCHYCACNVIVSQSRTAAGDYLDALADEARRVEAAIGARPPVKQLHLGGGTPTFLTDAELDRLLDILEACFDLSASDERAVEVDPRVTSKAQLETLAKRGFNRISVGVQDFDPRVQHAINRTQSLEETAELVTHARGLGFSGVNLDLIYGLPYQTEASFEDTLRAVDALAPDRIALYGYAHVPGMRPAQRRFDNKGYPLPQAEERYKLFRLAVERLLEGGFVHLGLDHFARPDDELALAAREGRLHRNFQGYTVSRAEDLVALGVSGISEVGGVFAQNHKELTAYTEALAEGRLPIQRGWASTPDDRARREMILRVMTGRSLPLDLEQRFPAEAAAFADFEADGLIARGEGGRWQITSVGRFFLRNLAMVFDAYLEPGGVGTFSKTV
jgi:oxygen-independent coproporphyrinogen-3 oxidase